ncbi:MAG: dTMP kinase [Candidatus Paceibacterota bacterium]|jgi:dTMP kinase
MPLRGKILEVEGGECSGKGTIIPFFKEVFAGKNVSFLREPGGTPMGEKLRDFLLYSKGLSIDALTEALLFYAPRSENVATLVRPTVVQGMNWVFDRFSTSTEVYQFRARGHADMLDKFRILDDLVVGDCKPDLTLYLDVLPEETMRRLRFGGRPDQISRFDAQPVEYHRKIREGYLEALKTRKHVTINTMARPGESIPECIERVKRESLKVACELFGINLS